MTDLQYRLEKAVQGAFERVGVRIEYIDETSEQPTLYPGAVYGALATRNEPLNVMVVGANDGKHNNPIFDVVQANVDSR